MKKNAIGKVNCQAMSIDEGQSHGDYGRSGTTWSYQDESFSPFWE